MPDALGDEILVNATTANNQRKPAVASLADGGFVVAWEDTSQTGGDTNEEAIRAQVFGPNGSPEGGEILVNTDTESGQENPSVTGLNNGDFVVAWTDGSTQPGGLENQDNIKAQRFDSSGSKLGDSVILNPTQTGIQDMPDLAALGDGGFVATWQDGAGTNAQGGGIRGQVFGPQGGAEGGEFLANTTSTFLQEFPVAAGLDDGGFTFLWEDSSNAASNPSRSVDIRGQTFAADGTTEGGEVVVHGSITADAQEEPDVAGLTDGRFVAAWQDPGNLPGAENVAVGARLFNSDGSPAGEPFRANANTTGRQDDPAVAPLPGGGFVTAWTDTEFGDAALGGATSEVVVQEFNKDGSRSGEPAIANSALQGDQFAPELANLESGGYVAVWTDGSEPAGDGDASAIEARLFNRPDDAPPPDDGGSTAGQSQGRAFLADDAGLTLADPAEVFGGQGAEHVFVAGNVTGVKTDANVERLDIDRSFGDIGFQVTNNGLEIIKDGTTIVTIPSANQAIELRFQDGDVTLTQTGAQMFELEGDSGSVTVDTSGADTAAVTPGGATAARPSGGGDASAANVFLSPNASFTVAQAAKIFGSTGGSERVIVADGAKGVRTDANVEGLDVAESLSSVDFQVTDNGLELRLNGETVTTLPSLNGALDLRLADGSLNLSQVGAQSFTFDGANGDSITIDADSDSQIDITLDGDTATDISLPGVDTSTLDDGFG